jgi:hypothetical protein
MRGEGDPPPIVPTPPMTMKPSGMEHTGLVWLTYE